MGLSKQLSVSMDVNCSSFLPPLCFSSQQKLFYTPDPTIFHIRHHFTLLFPTSHPVPTRSLEIERVQSDDIDCVLAFYEGMEQKVLGPGRTEARGRRHRRWGVLERAGFEEIFLCCGSGKGRREQGIHTGTMWPRNDHQTAEAVPSTSRDKNGVCLVR